MKMDHRQEFEKLWTNHFPDVDIPILSCFEETKHAADNFSGLVQSSLEGCRKRVDDLQSQVQREVFIIDYLEHICSKSDGTLHNDVEESNDKNLPNANGVEKKVSVKMRARIFQGSTSSSTDRESSGSSIASPSPITPKQRVSLGSDKRSSGKRAPPPPPPRRSKLTVSESFDESGKRESSPPTKESTPPPVMKKPTKLDVEPLYSDIQDDPAGFVNKINDGGSESPNYSEVANAIRTIDEALEEDPMASSSNSSSTRKPSIQRQNQYEEVSFDLPAEDLVQKPSRRDRRPRQNEYEEVSLDFSASIDETTEKVVEDSDDNLQLYAEVDKSMKTTKPKPDRSLNESVTSECLYEEIPLPPKSNSLRMEVSVSFDDEKKVFCSETTPESSEEEEDHEVYYKNIRMLRKQRRLTQTLHQLHEQRKSVSDIVVNIPLIEDDDDQEKLDSIDMDTVLLGREEVFDSVDAEEPKVGDASSGGVDHLMVTVPDDKLDSISCSDSIDSFQLDLSCSPVQSPGENEKLRMRKWVVTGILDSEHDYVDTLRVLQEIRHGLEMAAKSSQPVISLEDIDCMFFKIPALHKNHSSFVSQLEPVVQNWNPNSQVGTIFKEQAVYLTESVEYVKNYQKAISTFHKCCQESEQFKEMTQAIRLKPNSREVYTLDELLHKPVVRFQRGTLVLHDLLRSTPVNHPDHMWLQKAQKLTQYSLDALGSEIISGQENAENYLVRTSLIVEQIGHARKLRHVLLFNNVFICAKQRPGNKQKTSYEVKWFIPLGDLFVIDTLECDKAPVDKKRDKTQQEIDSLRTKVKSMKMELRREYNRGGTSGSIRQRNWSMSSRSSNRNVEKLKKKIAELETSLVLAEPRLVFTLMNKKITDKQFRFLLCSDYERNDWRDVISTMKAKAFTVNNMSANDVQQMIDNCKQLTKVSSLGTEAMREAIDPESMTGFLNVTIHKLDGLDKPCDTYTCVEVDSYGHFYMKAKTNIVCNSTKPEWNQDFEIDLDFSNTLRIMCYKHTSQQDVLLGKSALELSPGWLKESFQERIINLNELSLTISIRYTPRDKTLRKSMCRQKKQGVFGIKIYTVTKREGSKIPLIITGCVEEIEKRGLDEVGIYRVSGVTSEVQFLRGEFDKQSRNAVGLLKNYDINAVTGVLKMYLRELPEALFTDSLYPNFADAYELVDPDVRKNSMVSLLQSLPEPNFSTVVYLLNHLLRVSILEKENKMSQQNLATIFGPTLLRPAAKNKEGMSLETLLTMETKDAMIQSGILLYFLTLLINGLTFTKQEEKITQF